VNISQVVPASNSAGNEEDSTSSLPQEAVWASASAHGGRNYPLLGATGFYRACQVDAATLTAKAFFILYPSRVLQLKINDAQVLWIFVETR
jgi:hypothetical protein